MLKKTITFQDLDGNTITEDFYFNLTKAELTEMELSRQGGLQEHLTKIVQSQDGRQIIDTFKWILESAYGIRSADGRRFVKSPEAWLEFMQSDAYSELFMELVTDADAAAKFIQAVLPSGISEKVETVQLPTAAPQLEKGNPEKPAWELEDRDPTDEELRSMPRDELLRAMQRKNAQRDAQ